MIRAREMETVVHFPLAVDPPFAMSFPFVVNSSSRVDSPCKVNLPFVVSLSNHPSQPWPGLRLAQALRQAQGERGGRRRAGLQGRTRLLPALAFALGLHMFAGAAAAAATASPDGGRELILESLRRNAQPPFVFEEQTLVMSDRLGQHTVRTMRYYARCDDGGCQRLLRVQTPAESRGMSVFVARGAGGGARRGAEAASPIFGSDYSVADFEGEQAQDFLYEREAGEDLNRVPHLVLRARPKDDAVARATGYGDRRLYLRKDRLSLSRIDHLDRKGRVVRRQTFRDQRPDENGAWRAAMVLIEDLAGQRSTLLKIDRRVLSPDYVPAEIFAAPKAALALRPAPGEAEARP